MDRKWSPILNFATEKFVGILEHRDDEEEIQMARDIHRYYSIGKFRTE